MTGGTYTNAARKWLINDGMWREVVIGMSAKAVWAEIEYRYGHTDFVLDHDPITFEELLSR